METDVQGTFQRRAVSMIDRFVIPDRAMPDWISDANHRFAWSHGTAKTP
jgi:hypothetical protein